MQQTMIVGAIGHLRYLQPVQQRWLHSTLKSWLARWDVALGYSNLEPLVGTHFAQILCAAAIPFRAIIPHQVPTLPMEEQAVLLQLQAQAAGIHVMEAQDDSDPWNSSRLQVVEHCDVVFAVNSGVPEIDSPILAAQLRACLAERAVIVMDVHRQATHVACKHHQW